MVSSEDNIDSRHYVTMSTPVLSPSTPEFSPGKSDVVAFGTATNPPARRSLANVKRGDILYLLSGKASDYNVKHTYVVKDTKHYFPPQTAAPVIGFIVKNACQDPDAPSLEDMLCIWKNDADKYCANVVSNGEYNLDILCVDMKTVREILGERIEREEKILRNDIKCAKNWLHNRRDEMRRLKKAKKFYEL